VLERGNALSVDMKRKRRKNMKIKQNEVSTTQPFFFQIVKYVRS